MVRTVRKSETASKRKFPAFLTIPACDLYIFVTCCSYKRKYGHCTLRKGNMNLSVSLSMLIFPHECITRRTGNLTFQSSVYHIMSTCFLFIKCNLTQPYSSSSPPDGLSYHDKRTASSGTVAMDSFEAVEVRSDLFRTLHACFMIGAWICAASCGIMVARYFKKTWLKSRSCGIDQWFHVSCYCVSACLFCFPVLPVNLNSVWFYLCLYTLHCSLNSKFGIISFLCTLPCIMFTSDYLMYYCRVSYDLLVLWSL